MYFSKCPRCGDRSYEKLATHSYCVCCNYSPDLDGRIILKPDDLPIPQWATDAIENQKLIKKENIKIEEKNKSNEKKDAA